MQILLSAKELSRMWRILSLLWLEALLGMDNCYYEGISTHSTKGAKDLLMLSGKFAA
jgi:hypothetical protein